MPINYQEFNNKTVLVTGAASGIGEAIAKAFLQSGANVLAVDLDNDNLSKAFGNFSKA